MAGVVFVWGLLLLCWAVYLTCRAIGLLLDVLEAGWRVLFPLPEPPRKPNKRRKCDGEQYPPDDRSIQAPTGLHRGLALLLLERAPLYGDRPQGHARGAAQLRQAGRRRAHLAEGPGIRTRLSRPQKAAYLDDYCAAFVSKLSSKVAPHALSERSRAALEAAVAEQTDPKNPKAATREAPWAFGAALRDGLDDGAAASFHAAAKGRDPQLQIKGD